MKNSIKVIIFSLIGFSIAYYYILFLPTHLKDQEKHRLIIECRGLGQKLEKETTNPYDVSLRINPEYYYNPKLRKCFYCGGYTHDGFMAQFIIDAYTNKEIISCIKSIKNPSEGERDTAFRFNRLKRLLFDEIKKPKKYEIDIMRETIQ